MRSMRRRRRIRLSWRRAVASSGTAGRRLSLRGGARDLVEDVRAGWFILTFLKEREDHEGEKEGKEKATEPRVLAVPGLNLEVRGLKGP